MVEKFGGTKEATNDNMAHVLCITDKEGYTSVRTCTRSQARPRDAHTHTRPRPSEHTHTNEYAILSALQPQ
jgi:hypothetical protein